MVGWTGMPGRLRLREGSRNVVIIDDGAMAKNDNGEVAALDNDNGDLDDEDDQHDGGGDGPDGPRGLRAPGRVSVIYRTICILPSSV